MVVDDRCRAIHEGFNSAKSSRPVDHVCIERRI
jgi:hypothetical protein